MVNNGFYMAIGQQGSGKTLFITKLLVDSYNNRKIYSNYTLYGLPYTKITLNRDSAEDVPKLFDMLKDNPDIFNDSIILIDEIHLDLDSRDFMKNNQRQIQVFFSQLRKRNILLLATTQYIMHVDIRVRRQLKNVFDMTHVKDNIFQVITSKVDGYYTEEINRYFLNLSYYYKYYDTKEIIL